MLAITISFADVCLRLLRRRCRTCSFPTAFPAIAAFISVCAFHPGTQAHAQSPASEVKARQIFGSARSHFEKASTNVTAAWQLARAAFDLAEVVQDRNERLEVINTGLKASRHAISLDARSAPAHYYLALNIGQLARTKKIGALRLLHEMEHALLKAQRLDPKLDYAGPARTLGMLYLEAPPWPASVGNRNKARANLEAAVQLCPEYPENHIGLAEAYAKWGEIHNLDRQLKVWNELLPKARVSFGDPMWAATWKDWESRIQKLEKSRDHLLTNPRVSPSERGARTSK